MATGRLLGLTAVLILCLCSRLQALVPFGPPRAVIGAEHFALGAEYLTQTTQMTSFGLYKEGYVDGSVWYCKYNELVIQDLETQIALGTIGYGLGDSWDIYARVGMCTAQGLAEVPQFDSDNSPPTDFFNPGTRFDLDHGFDMAWGISSRMTFAESGDLAFGTIVQASWFSPKASEMSFKDPEDSTVTITGEVDLAYWEFQIALGATLNLGGVWLYGGPFVHFAKGTLDLSGYWEEEGFSNPEPVQLEHDIREDANFGAFGGMQWNAAENAGIYVEGIYLGDGWGVGGGGIIRVR